MIWENIENRLNESKKRKKEVQHEELEQATPYLGNYYFPSRTTV